MDSVNQNRRASAKISGRRAFVFHETALDGASFARDFLPAFFIMAVALVLSAWLPVEADTGLRPVESSLLVIVGSLAAIFWIIGRRLRRLKRRVLEISPDALRVYPPRGLLALPGQVDTPELEIRRDQITELTTGIADSTMSRIIRRKTGKALGKCHVETEFDSHVFDDLVWHPNINTVARVECEAAPDRRREPQGRFLEKALRLCGYPVGGFLDSAK